MNTYAIFLSTGPCLTVVGARLDETDDGELVFYGPDTMDDRQLMNPGPVIGRFSKTGIIGWCQMPVRKPEAESAEGAAPFITTGRIQ